MLTQHARQYFCSSRPIRRIFARVKQGCVAFLILSLTFPPQVFANDFAGSVAAGAASISQAGGNLTVNQLSDRAIINWQSFSIGADQTAQFNLPTTSSAILNRVTGSEASAILGTLNSNGQVYLLNPNGILIGPSANITVGGLVASTLNVADAEFMQGGVLNFEGSSRAGITNYGTVQALEGNIYMIGAHVENHGTLQALNGTVGLAAGQSVQLADGAHPQLLVRATSESLGGTGVLNTGLIEAARAELLANGGNVYGLAINNTGTIRATGAETREGRIFLVSEGGEIRTSGTLVARRNNDGGDVVLNAGGTEGSSIIVDGTIDVADGNIFIKAATIDIGGATFNLSGQTRDGQLDIRLGPHSVVVVPEGSGDALKFGSSPAPSMVDNEMSLRATSSDGANLEGFGNSGNLAREDGASFGTGDAPTIVMGTITSANGLQLESASASASFIGFITVDLQRTGGSSIPAGSEGLFTFEVLEPDGSISHQYLVVPIGGGNTKYSFQAQSGELIQNVVFTSSSTGYDVPQSMDGDPASTSPVPMRNPDGVPVINRVRNIKDVEVAAGVILIEKQTSPAGSLESFAFTLDESADPMFDEFDFMLSDDGIFSRALETGTYTVEEFLTAQQISDDWIISDIVLSGDTDGLDSVNLSDGSATIQLDQLDVVTVTFTNVQGGGSIIVTKDVLAGNENQAFGFDASFIAGTSPDFFVSESGGSYQSPILPAGSYSVEELALAGWDLDNVTLIDADTMTVLNPNLGNGSEFTLEAGQNLQLVFYNTQLGTILVEKHVSAGSVSQGFGFDASYIDSDLPDFTLADGQTHDSGFLRPGTYSVEELALAGWDLDNVMLIDADTMSVLNPDLSNGNEFTLAAGQNVQLVFKNTQLGTILVEKDVLAGSTTQGFGFDASYVDGDLPDFTLADGQTHDSGYLRPGTYSVEELAQAGWDLDNVMLIDGDTMTVIDNGSEFTLEAGQNLQLVFKNTQLGTIVVEKDVLAGSTTQGFGFDASYVDGDLPDFTLADGQTHDSGYLRPGTYSVEELAQAGWDLDNVMLIDGDTMTVIDNGSEFTLEAGQNLQLVFKNTQLGTIVVEKDVLAGSTNQGFGFDASYVDGDLPDFTLADGQTHDSGYLRPGTYSVEELALAGWDLDNVMLIDGETMTVIDNGSEFTLEAGQNLQLVFKNTQLGTIVVEKDVLAGSTTQGFGFDASYVDGDLPDFTLADGQTHDSGYLRPGTYSVEELALAGWDLDNVMLIDGETMTVIDNGSEFTLEAGQNLQLVFKNTQLGTILVEKEVLAGSTNQGFGFDASYVDGDLPDFTLADGQTHESGFLRPGTYSVEELALAGWDLDNVMLIDGDTMTVIDNGSEFTLEAGQNLQLVFKNTQLGTIVVEKDVLAGSTTQGFGFDASYVDGDLPDFTLADGQTHDSGYLRPGTYSVEELAQAGWDLDNVMLIDGETMTVIDNGSEFTLEAGQNLQLVFKNTQLGTIVVEKDVLAGSTNQGFGFGASYIDGDLPDFTLADGQTHDSGYLRPGTYSVEELAQAGWDLDNVMLIDGDTMTVIDNGSEFTLEAGQNLQLVFKNTQLGTIVVEKDVLAGSTNQGFGFDASYIDGDLPDFTLADGQTHESGFLRPGTYSVEELALAGWDLDNVMLIDADTMTVLNPDVGNGNEFTLAAGQNVQLVFKNTQLGTIVVEKDVLAGSTNQGFGFDASYVDGDLPDFTLADGETNSSGFLRPGTYSVEELALAGWDLDNVTLVDADTMTVLNPDVGNGNEFTLAAGQNVQLVFKNTQLGTILVRKVVDGFDLNETEFGFVSDFDPSEFSLADGESVMNSSLRPGQYTVQELVSRSRIQLTDITIGNGSGITNLADGLATVNLGAGDSVTVTFTNTVFPPAFFKWDPIYPSGVGTGRAFYGTDSRSMNVASSDQSVDAESDDEAVDGELTGNSSFNLFQPN